MAWKVAPLLKNPLRPLSKTVFPIPKLCSQTVPWPCADVKRLSPVTPRARFLAPLAFEGALPPPRNSPHCHNYPLVATKQKQNISSVSIVCTWSQSYRPFLSQSLLETSSDKSDCNKPLCELTSHMVACCSSKFLFSRTPELARKKIERFKWLYLKHTRRHSVCDQKRSDEASREPGLQRSFRQRVQVLFE